MVFLASTVLYTKLVCSSRSLRSRANGTLSPNRDVRLGSARLMTVGNSFKNSSNLWEPTSEAGQRLVDQGNPGLPWLWVTPRIQATTTTHSASNVKMQQVRLYARLAVYVIIHCNVPNVESTKNPR